MSTIKTTLHPAWAPAIDNNDTAPATGILNRFRAFADTQAQYRTLWFFGNLIVHGVFILPIPIMLIYYFNAPALILVITMACFFANLIANMGGAGIRATLGLFAIPILIHAGMLLFFIV